VRGRLQREAAEGEDATLLVAVHRPLLEAGGNLLDRKAEALRKVLRPDRLSLAKEAVEPER
jgi:hypothetical protein